MNRIDENIEIGISRLNSLFPENSASEPQRPKSPIDEMEAAGVDMQDVKEAAGGSLDNVLQVERISDSSWQLKVRRITPSGNYTETIKITAASNVLAESTQSVESVPCETKYRLTPDEASQQVAEVLGSHLLKVETIRGDAGLIALHLKENHDTQAMHRIFADLNSSMHQGGWHVTMREDRRWTMSPSSGAFLEKRSTLRNAGSPNHLYPPSYYAGRSTEAMLRSTEMKDQVSTVSEGAKGEKLTFAYEDEWSRSVYKTSSGKKYVDVDGELHGMTDEGEPTYPVGIKTPQLNESDARKRAYKAGYPMVPQHAVAHSTDTIMYPAIGDNDKFRNGGNQNNKESKPKAKKDNGVSVMNKAVSVSGDFL